MFYEEIYEATQVIKKLDFGFNLNNKQIQIKQWLIEWLERQESSYLSRFCLNITGFHHPRNLIRVSCFS